MTQTLSHQITAPIVWMPFTILFLLLTACSVQENPVPAAEGVIPMTIELTSSSFNDGQAIPQKFSCDGEDISPPLEWDNIPAEAVSLALIMDDPDAPGSIWVHWVLYDISATTTELPEDLASAGSTPNARSQGTNSWDRLGYGGPCPPSGSHRYFFNIYALDTHLALDAGATKEEVLQEMEGHILAQGQMMGTYERN